jgi:hypothetical protein
MTWKCDNERNIDILPIPGTHLGVVRKELLLVEHKTRTLPVYQLERM